MENYDDFPTNPKEHLTVKAKSHIKSIGNLMFIVSIIGGLFMLLMMGMLVWMITQAPGEIISIIIGMLIVFAITLPPLNYLYQAANAFRQYTATHDMAYLEEGFIKNKSFWKYIGILVVIYLVFLALALAFGGLAMLSSF